MNLPIQHTPFGPHAISRREFLQRWGMGVGGLAMGSMLAQQRLIVALGQPHFAPKAKSVIFSSWSAASAIWSRSIRSRR